ncbi:MAG: S8 family serine peptidase [Acidimicrobiales bacterium]|nr:S8 family serine peptidase [Acidimicrobiales bacterium]
MTRIFPMRSGGQRRVSVLIAGAVLAAVCSAVPTAAQGGGGHPRSAVSSLVVVSEKDVSGNPEVRVAQFGAQILVDETGVGAFFVQFESPLSKTDRDGLFIAGVTFAQPIPPATYLVHLGPGALESVTSHPDFVGFTPVATSDKLSPSLQAEAIATDTTRNAADGSSVTGYGDVLGHVEFFDGADLTEGVAAATNVGLTVLNPDRFSLGKWLSVEGSPAALASLASNPMIVAVSEGSRLRTTTNVVAQGLSNSNVLQAAGLTGDGEVIGIWDGGKIGRTSSGEVSEHPDLAGRVTNHSELGTDFHATHVAGTIAGDGSGNAAAEGMAPDAELHLWDYYGDPYAEMEDASSAQGITISNHSWGYCTGRHSCGGSGWAGEDGFGAYDVESQWADAVVIATNQIVVKAASNDRNDCGFQLGDPDNCDGVLSGDGEYYDNITDFGNAKNVITVGAINDDGVSITSFSSAGPANDGRIKPDVVANGDGLLSTWDTSTFSGYYSSISGTSMATPVVTGILAQLSEHYRTLNAGADLPPDLAKALLINTSTDLGRFGPDYLYGYGLVNATDAKHQVSHEFNRIDSVTNTEIDEYVVVVAAGTTALEVTLNWIDPTGVINNPAADIINNLDLELVAPDGSTVHYPWTGPGLANPASLSTRTGANTIDTAEKVDVATPTPGRWTIRITGTGITSGPQTYALVTSSALVDDNDLFYNAESIGGPYATTNSTNTGFTTEPAEPACFTTNSNSTSAWWIWTASTSNTVTIDTLGSNFDTVLGVYTGNTLATLVSIGCDDDTDTSTQSSVTFGATAGTTYHIQVSGFAGATGNITLNITGPPGAPTNPETAYGDSQVTVSWTAPADDGGKPITGYAVSASPNGATCVTASTSCVVSGLANGTEYTFTVVATNTKGDSAASAEVSATPSMVLNVADIGVVCSVAQQHPFTDISTDSYAYDSVGCIYALDVTTGINATEYGPANTVTREQMAAFLARFYETVTGQECAGDHPFTDVSETSYAYNSVGCIYGLNITTGINATEYGPANTVTREQMAAFLERLYNTLTS